MLIDEDHNGIDDRVERYYGPLARLMETTRRYFSAPPPVEAVNKGLPASLAEVAQELLRVKYKRIPYPSPTGTLASGYEYRTVPARALATVMKVDPNVLALAVTTSSEASRSTIPTLRDVVEELAIAEAVLNDAAAVGVDAVARVTNETILVRRTKGGNPAPVPAAGHFGRQGGRWCASLLPPTEHGLAVGTAAIAAASSGRGFTGGARRWTHLRTMDWLRRKHGTGQDAADNVKARYSEGWRVVAPILDAKGALLLHPWDDVCLYSRTGELTMAEAMVMVENGRQRFPG